MTRVLCIHGLGGTAATMQPLADALSDRGHDVSTITLPGHGTVADDLLTTEWSDWLASVAAAVVDRDISIVVGQSMGASLALAIAAHGAVDGVVAINPPPPDPDALDGLEWRLSRGHMWVDGPEPATTPAGQVEDAYTRLPIIALFRMTAGVLDIDLGAVHVPVLIISSAHDEVVDPASATDIASALDAPVEHIVLPHSGHTATFGPDLPMLTAAIDAFVQRATS